MSLKRLILVFTGILFASGSFGQIQGELIQSRILILLDRSSSMTQGWAGGKEKFKAADEIIMKLMDSVYTVNRQVEFGLRVFGHQNTVEENNCLDSKLEVAFSRENKDQMSLRLADIHPLGVTAIAYSLKQSAERDLLDETHNIYSIVLITDGGESCGGDICEVMKTLINNKVYFKPYILNLEDNPSLKQTYSCMGDYLQVLKKGDIAVAVGAIVEAFRPALRTTTTDYTEIQSIAANAPSVLKVNVPVKTKADLQGLPLADHKLIPVYSRPQMDLKIVALPRLVAAPVAEEPHTTEKMLGVKPALPKLIGIKPPVARVVIPVTELKPPALVMDAPAPDKESVARLKPAALKQFNVIFIIEDHELKQRRLPAVPPLKIDPSIAALIPEPVEKPLEYTSESIDAQETSLEVYFTNGNGRFFTTTPQIMMLDPATHKVVKKFYRTVDPDGNPDPQTNIAVGTYDLSLTARSDMVVHNVTVELNKRKKIVVTVKNSSISFAYENAPKRPVKEFMAVVIERNRANGRVQNQKCTDQLEYEPGNYHIEINTFPKDVRNVDIDFDETVITIPQPGFARFNPDPKVTSVILYQRLGDKFLSFYTLDLNNPVSKHLQIQPGEYQAHYQKGGSSLHMTEQVVQFLIKPVQETEVILK